MTYEDARDKATRNEPCQYNGRCHPSDCNSCKYFMGFKQGSDWCYTNYVKPLEAEIEFLRETIRRKDRLLNEDNAALRARMEKAWINIAPDHIIECGSFDAFCREMWL